MDTQPAASPPANAQFDMFACTVGRSDQPVEKQRGVERIIPGESQGLVRKSERKVDPIKPAKVDLVRGKRVRGPVWIVSHYERTFAVGERGGREERTSHVEKRGGIREKAKEDQDRGRNDKCLHIKKLNREMEPAKCMEVRERETEFQIAGPLRHPLSAFGFSHCDVAPDFQTTGVSPEAPYPLKQG